MTKWLPSFDFNCFLFLRRLKIFADATITFRSSWSCSRFWRSRENSSSSLKRWHSSSSTLKLAFLLNRWPVVSSANSTAIWSDGRGWRPLGNARVSVECWLVTLDFSVVCCGWSLLFKVFSFFSQHRCLIFCLTYVDSAVEKRPCRWFHSRNHAYANRLRKWHYEDLIVQ